MKKIFTLFTGLLLAVAVFAADHRPVVRLMNARNFKVVIDGRSYFGDNLTLRLDNFYGSPYGNSNGNSFGGRQHTIRVYEMRRGMFFTRERLVDTKTFVLGREDLIIRVDMFGQIRIREMRFGNSRWDRDDYYRNGQDGRWNNDQDGRWNNDQDGHWNNGQDPYDRGQYDRQRDGRDRF